MLIRIKVTYYIDFRDFHGRTKPRNTENKNLKRDTVGNLIALYENRDMAHKIFNSEIFPLKKTEGC